MRTHLPRASILLALLTSLALIGLPAAAVAQDDGQGVAQPGGTLPGEPAIELVEVASGFADPVNIAAPDDGSDRLFVVERPGTIRIVDADGNVLEEPFLDISNRVKTDFLEQGLLGLAFPPDYGESGRFYVYYSDYSTNGNLRLVRYSVSDDPNLADPESGELILEIADDPYFNHNGGNVVFGPDGYLYWSTGDGGSAGDPFENAQNIRNLFGKIGRIDVSPETGYAIPEDNPFAQSGQVQLQAEDPALYHPGASREIWAYGLRNPWQFSFDQETGDLYIADVGQNAWEEINFAAADAGGGQNYGWDFLEGSHCYPAEVTDCPRTQVGELPVAEISHEDGDCSITGLGVHRGEGSAALNGIYFASDFCSGRVWGLARDDGGDWQLSELLDTTLLAAGGGNDAAGNVYLTSCECVFGRQYDPLANPTGVLWQVVAADEAGDATTAPLEGEAQASAAPEEEASAPDDEASPAPEDDATPAPDDDGADASPAPDGDGDGNASPPPDDGDASPAPDGDGSPPPDGDASAAPDGDGSPAPDGDASPAPEEDADEGG
jgi:glucose/arabinose dehydrogenase